MLRWVLALILLLPMSAAMADITGKSRIVDGETIHIGDTKIRLHGIGAPEMKQTCTTSNGAEQLCGVLAKQALLKLVRGQEVICKGDTRDRYKRLIATCYVGSLNINERTVADGWAMAYRKYSKDYVGLTCLPNPGAREYGAGHLLRRGNGGKATEGTREYYRMFIAMNRFRIIKGEETEFERIWAERDTHLHEVPGFVEFHLLRGAEKEDHMLYASHTVWESHQHFEDWTKSEAFRKTHANAGGGKKDIYQGPPKFESPSEKFIHLNKAFSTSDELRPV